jgi:hypothetical protein
MIHTHTHDEEEDGISGKIVKKCGMHHDQTEIRLLWGNSYHILIIIAFISYLPP